MPSPRVAVPRRSPLPHLLAATFLAAMGGCQPAPGASQGRPANDAAQTADTAPIGTPDGPTTDSAGVDRANAVGDAMVALDTSALGDGASSSPDAPAADVPGQDLPTPPDAAVLDQRPPDDRSSDGGAGDGSAVADAAPGEGGDGSTSAHPCPSGMVRIPAKDQSFMMGFTPAEGGTEWACFLGKHKVTFTYDFCMDSTLVLQTDYMKLMGNNPSAHKSTDPKMPVDAVTWFDAILYCNERSKQEGLDPVYTYTALTRSGNHVTAMTGIDYDIKKNGYRLPTNAEYEYAERADLTDYTYIFSKTATSDINSATSPANAYSWNLYNSENSPHPVALKKPNPWGLYDIIGNLFEWENDWEGPYQLTDQVDPLGPADGNTPCGTDNTATPKRMGKGGSYAQDPKNHGRISYHYKFFPQSAGSQIGFRCVSTIR